MFGLLEIYLVVLLDVTTLEVSVFLSKPYEIYDNIHYIIDMKWLISYYKFMTHITFENQIRSCVWWWAKRISMQYNWIWMRKCLFQRFSGISSKYFVHSSFCRFCREHLKSQYQPIGFGAFKLSLPRFHWWCIQS